MVASGTLVYRCDCNPCKGAGYAWSQRELDEALSSDVGEIVRDDLGKKEVLDIFKDGKVTEFDMAGLMSLFNANGNDTKNWQIGEAIANAYLCGHRECLVPWNTQRDLRTPKGSLPGVDICGIRNNSGCDQFFFCEVKTSSEEAYPPQVASRNPNGGGLAAQVEELRDNVNVRGTIINYLAVRAIDAIWKDRFRKATLRYIRDANDISIFGFMVRDVTPDARDLEKRVMDVAKSTFGPQIEFLALYLPQGQIATLAGSVNQGDATKGATC